MPHPCSIDETLEGCSELAAQHGLETALDGAAAAVPSIKEALVANAPMITERLNAAMMKVGEWVEATEGFAVEQAPFLVQEIIWWAVADAGFWIALGLILMLCNPAVQLYLRCSSNLEEYKGKFSAALAEKGSGGELGFAIIGGIILPIIGFLCIIINIMDMLKPLVAPRLYLMEYFKDLIR